MGRATAGGRTRAMGRTRAVVALLGALGVVGACGPGGEEAGRSPGAAVHSTAFTDGGDIPVEHTCEGEDLPPPLEWEGVDPDAVELVLVVDDPDAPAGAFPHWLVAGLAPTDAGLRGDVPSQAVEGTNGFGELGWAGPCPPPGDAPHTYRFEVVGLARPTSLAPGFTADELAAAMDGHELSSAVLEGRYGR